MKILFICLLIPVCGSATQLDIETLKDRGLSTEVIDSLINKETSKTIIASVYYKEAIKGVFTIKFIKKTPFLPKGKIKELGIALDDYMPFDDDDYFSLDAIKEKYTYFFNEKTNELYLYPSSAGKLEDGKGVNNNTLGFLNYDFISTKSRYGTNDYFQFLPGLNYKNWLLRASLTNSSSRVNELNYLYAQHDISNGYTGQLGHIFPQNKIFSMPEIYGVQISKDSSYGQNMVVIPIFTTVDSKVDIMQNNTNIKTEFIKSGGANVDVSLISAIADVDLTITDITGNVRTESIPAITLLNNKISQTGAYVSAGKNAVKNFFGNEGERKSFHDEYISSLGYTSSNGSNEVSVSSVISNDAFSIGTGIASDLSKNEKINLRALGSKVKSLGIGDKYYASLSSSRLSHLPLAIGGGVLNRKYTEPYQYTSHKSVGDYDEYTFYSFVGASLNSVKFGYFSFLYNNNQGNNQANTFSVRWQYNFRNFSFFSRFSNNVEGNSLNDTRLMVGVTYSPTSSNSYSVSTDFYESEKTTQFSASHRFNENDYVNGSLNQDTSGNINYINASAGMTTEKTSLYGQFSSNNNYMGVGARGALSVSNRELFFTPYKIDDTVAIIKTTGLKNAAFQTRDGLAYTNGNGYALANITAYADNLISVDSRSMDQDISGTDKMIRVNPIRGDVYKLSFNFKKIKRVLFQVKGLEGYRNATVYDQNKNFISILGSDYTFFVDDMTDVKSLSLHFDNGKECELSYSYMSEEDNGVLYSDGMATCKK